MMKWSLALALVLGLAAVAAAADEILLHGGDEVEGEILSVDETGMKVKVGDKTYDVAPADLDAHYYYEQWAKRVPKDAKAHLRLAVFAYENGMFNQARSQYRKADRLDKAVVQQFELEVVPRIKEGVAEQLLERASNAVDQKDWDDAKRILAKILTELEDTKAAEQAREKLASVHMWQLNADEERLVKSLARYLPKDEAEALRVQERVEKKAGPIKRKIKSAQGLVTKALRTKSTNRQKGIFEQAGKKFGSVVNDLDKLAQQAGQDEALQAQIKEARATAAREGVDAYVNAGNTYLIRRSYDQAMKMANAALAMDPESDQAKQFQARTIRGSQQRSGWWGRGR